ncbi:type VII secretion integral membrane protein EccD [Streptomyces sp. DSM 42041]|uniref:Type VII secretion integral membrane protein EccD n=1 Tax=Streptomyces hazeniae TaxID=3075538 RepID=A0ABU2NPD7_9ACTN|nr:type VII secretion integral membrane protein EccD [Streptomyces sp. DSM 42041]MDT0378841.1 type VII secretion integral membrane protein EccD [Streptomyces sp. DSM 42041]
MATTAATGFCRVTVVAPGGRIDVALPEGVPLSDVYPEIARLSGGAAEGSLSGYHLVRRDGGVLEAGLSLAGNGIRDGEVLLLRPFADSLPAAVFDDVSDAVASAVRSDRTLWNEKLMRIAGLTGGGVLLVLMAFALWFADPVKHDMHGLPGIIAAAAGVLLVALACVRARVYDDRASSIALGLGAMPHIMIAGSGALPLGEGDGIGRLQFLLGCVAVLLASVVLIAITPSGDGPFVSAAVAAAVGSLITFIAILSDIEPVEAAAVAAPLAVGTIAFLPGLSARFARLPVGFEPRAGGPGASDREGGREIQGPVDGERIATQARRGHELLVGLVGGFCAVVIGAASVLGFSDDGWAQLLALAAGLAMLLRARLFRYTSQVSCALIAGLGALALLALGLSLNSPTELVRDMLLGDSTGMDFRTIWIAASIAAAAALVTAIGLIIPRTGLSPFWGRFMEISETFVLLTLIPLCLAVHDVYSEMRGLIG